MGRTVVGIKVLVVEETLVESTGVLLGLGEVEHDFVWITGRPWSQTERDGWHGWDGSVCRCGYLCISEGHALLHLVVYGGLADILPRRWGL